MKRRIRFAGLLLVAMAFLGGFRSCDTAPLGPAAGSVVHTPERTLPPASGYAAVDAAFRADRDARS